MKNCSQSSLCSPLEAFLLSASDLADNFVLPHSKSRNGVRGVGERAAVLGELTQTLLACLRQLTRLDPLVLRAATLVFRKSNG